MLRKISITFTIMLISGMLTVTLNIFDAPTVKAEKTDGIAEISTKPSIVVLATAMKSFRASLSRQTPCRRFFPTRT